mgnify:CR=1 FL=1
MNKFESIVGNNSNAVLARRAGNLAKTARLSQQSLVNTLEAKKADVEGKIINLTDLAPTSKDSLAPGVTDFDAKEWVEKLQSLKLEIYDLDVSIRVARDTYNEFFAEVEPKKPTKGPTDKK